MTLKEFLDDIMAVVKDKDPANITVCFWAKPYTVEHKYIGGQLAGDQMDLDIEEI